MGKRATVGKATVKLSELVYDPPPADLTTRILRDGMCIRIEERNHSVHYGRVFKWKSSLGLMSGTLGWLVSGQGPLLGAPKYHDNGYTRGWHIDNRLSRIDVLRDGLITGVTTATPVAMLPCGITYRPDRIIAEGEAK